MKFQINLQSDIDNNINMNDKESLKNQIQVLENIHANIRTELYSYFLGKRSWRYALFMIVFTLGSFMLTNKIFYLYVLFFSILAIMLISLILAETTARAVRKHISIRIQDFKNKLDALKRKENII